MNGLSRLLAPSPPSAASITTRVSPYLAPAALAVLGLSVSAAISPDGRGVLGGLLAVCTIAIAWIDARSLLIPNRLVLAVLALGLLHAGLDDWSAVEALGAAAARGVATFALFYLLRAGYRRLRGREGLGFGDVKLAGAAGVWLDFLPLTFAIELAAVGALLLVALQYARGDGGVRHALIPFGLFLAPAIWAGWVLQTLLA